MSGFGEQRQRMSPDTGPNQQHDVAQGHGERNLQNPGRTARAMSVHVHISSVRAPTTRGNFSGVGTSVASADAHGAQRQRPGRAKRARD